MWAEEEPMKPIRIPNLDPEQLDALEVLYPVPPATRG